MAPGTGTAAKAGTIAVGLAGTVVALAVWFAGPPVSVRPPVPPAVPELRHPVVVAPAPPAPPEPPPAPEPPPKPAAVTDDATVALAAALRRLADDQQPDGRWTLDDDPQDAPGAAAAESDSTELGGLPDGLTDVGRTALVLNAFMRAGYTPRMSPTDARPHAERYRNTVMRGLWWLWGQQQQQRSRGLFGDYADAAANHAVALLAVATACAASDDPVLRRMTEAATELLLRWQEREPGDDTETVWRGWPGTRAGVVTHEATTGWVAAALTAVRKAGGRGLPDRLAHGITATLRQDPRAEITPVRMLRDVRYILARHYAGDTAAATAETRRALFRLTEPPVIGALSRQRDATLFALGSAVITLAPQQRREAWTTAVLDALLKTQRRPDQSADGSGVDESPDALAGSWDADDRIAATALAAWTIASLTGRGYHLNRALEPEPIHVSTPDPPLGFWNVHGPALHALASMQKPDGSWPLVTSDSPDALFGAPEGLTAVGRTGFVVVTFFSHGYDHRTSYRGRPDYRELIRRGLDFLIAAQADDGWIGGDDAALNHAIATHALAEAYDMTGDPKMKAAATRATTALVGRRLSASGAADRRGWSARPNPSDLTDATPDTATTLWAVWALKSARTATLEPPHDALREAEAYFDVVVGEEGNLVADAAFVLTKIVNSLDGSVRDDKALRAAMMRFTEAVLPDPDAAGPHSITLLLHGITAAYQMDGRWWDVWRFTLPKFLVPRQRRDAAPPDADPGFIPPKFGTWDADDRVFATAAALLILNHGYACGTSLGEILAEPVPPLPEE
jgi:hypothetical protein